MSVLLLVTRFFYKQRSFSTLPQYCLTFSWFELQMLLRCYLIRIRIIIMRHYAEILFILHFFSMSRPRTMYIVSVWSIFHFHLHFHYYQSCIISWIQTYLFFCLYFRISYHFWIITWVKNANNLQITKASGCCLAFAWFFANFSLAWLTKVLLIKKACICSNKFPMCINILHVIVLNKLKLRTDH